MCAQTCCYIPCSCSSYACKVVTSTECTKSQSPWFVSGWQPSRPYTASWPANPNHHTRSHTATSPHGHPASRPHGHPATRPAGHLAGHGQPATRPPRPPRPASRPQPRPGHAHAQKRSILPSCTLVLCLEGPFIFL